MSDEYTKNFIENAKLEVQSHIQDQPSNNNVAVDMVLACRHLERIFGLIKEIHEEYVRD